MTVTRVILLQKVVRNILLNVIFCNQWTSVTSLGKALSIQYKFENIITSKATISRVLGKIDHNLSNILLSQSMI